MNSKMIFLSGLLFAIVVGMLTFGFLTYVLINDATKVYGLTMVKNHQMLFYIQLIAQILAFGFAAGVFYKR